VYAATRAAVERAAAGEGPTLVEAVTYRMEAHTNADDAARYRSSDEVRQWEARDPIARLDAYLRGNGILDDAAAAEVLASADQFAARVREQLNADAEVDPAELFAHVYARPTAALDRQRAHLLAAIGDAQ
jgi:pyruvate dehydrogenase E1 component alpha subunit